MEEISVLAIEVVDLTPLRKGFDSIGYRLEAVTIDELGRAFKMHEAGYVTNERITDPFVILGICTENGVIPNSPESARKLWHYGVVMSQRSTL